MSELQPGVFLGRYEMLVRIGRGGMASVWIARERSAVSGKQRLVAVKAMLPELARHTEFRSMFLGEVQIIQSIQHDNVVRVFEVSEDRNILYMVMEWVEGDSLRNVIKASREHGALPAEIAICVAADAAAGLHAAHELRDWDGELRGIVHCDVSPHNILLGLDGNSKLVDFGIANALGRLSPNQNSETIQGKLRYMSPEQARGEPVDRRTDIFALGIILFEMTTGERLFKGRDAAHTLELVKHGNVPRPSQLNPRYPRRLESMTMKALERDRERRFQTAEEFEYALSSYLTEEHTVVSHHIVASLLTQLMGARIEKRREVIAAIVAAIENQKANGGLSSPTTPWFPDIPAASDPMNSTLTGHSETGLGIAARLENYTSSSVPLPAPTATRTPRPTSNNLWRWFGAFAVVLLSLAIGAGYYMHIVRTDQTKAVALTASSAPDSPQSSSPPANTNSVNSQTGNQHSDTPLSVDSLPIEGPENGPSPTAAGGKSKKDKKSDDRPAPTSENIPSARIATAAPPPQTAEPAPAKQPAEEPATDKPAAPVGIDHVAANSALASAAAASRACRSYGVPPSPQGRTAVTFTPDGSVAAVSLSQNFIGTPIGNCVLGHYRNARVPSYTGDATTLFSSFDLSN